MHTRRHLESLLKQMKAPDLLIPTLCISNKFSGVLGVWGPLWENPGDCLEVLDLSEVHGVPGPPALADPVGSSEHLLTWGSDWAVENLST